MFYAQPELFCFFFPYLNIESAILQGALLLENGVGDPHVCPRVCIMLFMLSVEKEADTKPIMAFVTKLKFFCFLPQKRLDMDIFN